MLWVRGINENYTNLTLFFVVFSTLYGISGPISVLWGEGLDKLFSNPYNTKYFLISYALANIGLVFGVILFNFIENKIKHKPLNCSNNLNLSNIQNKIFNIGIVIALITSISELINLLRIGGFELLFSGKAIYQSLVSQLTLTLPSADLAIISCSLIGLYLGLMDKGKEKTKWINVKVNYYLMCLSPYLIIKIILGQRGVLLSLIICTFIGITYFKPLKSIKLKLIVVVGIIYVFMSLLYANRSIVSLIFDEPKLFFEKAFNSKRIINSLKPESNEFGAAYGNYSQFYEKYGNTFKPRLGETYAKGLLMPIPSFLYPGVKPTQITYEFRDEFFASEANRGTIAGTAFSSILEAYINFKYVGVLFIYLLIGYFLQKIDKIYQNKSLFFTILYIASFSQTVNFHRSAFGDVFASIFIEAVIIYIIMLFLKLKFKKIIKAIKNPKLTIIYILNFKAFRIIPDTIFLKIKYRLTMGKKLDLSNTKTFNEKLQWLKLYDRNPLYTNLVDKYEVRKYIEKTIGKDYLIPLLGVYDDFEQINFNTLPNQFVLKPSHTSGDIYICKDKKNINFTDLKKKVNMWLKRRYYWIHREWPYKNVKPKIICEKYMVDESGTQLKDYKFMCFNGDVKCSFVCLNRNSINGLNVDFYDMNWKNMPFTRHYPNSGITIPRPENFDKMVEFAKKLSKGIPFVRVDFYEVYGHLYFGELTFYPGSGYEEFNPESYDYLLGSWIKLPNNI
jgi:oligosaccharide repeat unit polymerase